MRTFPYIALSLVLSAGLSDAASFTVDFDDSAYPIPDEGNPTPIIDGIDGWSQSATTPSGERYAWISTSFGSGNSLTYGGYYSELPETFSVSRNFSGLAPGEKSLSFQSHITDTVPFDPETPTLFGRDTFGFQVRNSGGDLLLTVNLVPVTQDYVADGGEASGYQPGQWEIVYAFGSDPSLTSTTNSILSTGVNFFSVDFGEDGLAFNYGQGDSSSFRHEGTAAGYDVNDTGLELTFTYERFFSEELFEEDPDQPNGNGENHIRIDNINVIDGIPEPTTAALAALGSLALLRRRRVN